LIIILTGGYGEVVKNWHRKSEDLAEFNPYAIMEICGEEQPTLPVSLDLSDTI
jgi:hypothetical protein